MNVDMSAYHTVHSFPGGSAALAPSLGVSEAALNSKVNPNTKTHRLALAEAVTLMEVSGDHRIFFALAERLGYAVDRIGEGRPVEPLADLLMRHAANSGSLASKMSEALQDGVVTPREMTGIADAAHATQASIAALVDSVRRAVPAAPVDGA